MMSCAGNKWLKTPAMDSLAAKGTRFTRAYCTNPVCTPSRFSLMTGKMPSYMGVYANSDTPDTSKEKLDEIKKMGIGHILGAAGYDAVYGGKTHLPGFSPEDIGFNILTRDSRGTLAEACADYIRNHDRAKPLYMCASFINPHDICLMAIEDAYGCMDGKDGRNVTPSMMEYSRGLKEIMDTWSKEKFNECPPLPFNHEKQNDEPEAISLLMEQRPFKKYVRENWGEKEWRLHRWAFCRLCEKVDSHIAVILKAIEDAGMMEDSLIIFSTDHGEMDSAHRMEHKECLYEEACRVPLIIKPPASSPRRAAETDRLVSNGLDMLPTILDYADISTHANYYRGRSLRPLVEGFEIKQRDYLPIECENGLAIVSEKYKYTVYNKGESREQFYDLDKDPGEMHNFLKAPDKQGSLEELRLYYQKEFNPPH